MIKQYPEAYKELEELLGSERFSVENDVSTFFILWNVNVRVNFFYMKHMNMKKM